MTVNSVEIDFLKTLTVINTTDKTGIGGNVDGLTGLPTIRSVCNSVIMKLRSLDTENFGKSGYNVTHWNRYSSDANRYVLAEPYLAHAIINVANRQTGEDVVAYINNVFKNDRGMFPRDKGWSAVFTDSDSEVRLSDNSHPFFYYKNTRNINSKVSRILVVVNMAREGLNNKYINVWGCARDTSSIIDIVQRIGRQLRTACAFYGDTINVQPCSHDTVFIITHNDFPNSVNMIKRGLRFIMNSKSVMSNMDTIDDYIASTDGVDDVDYDVGAQLGFWARYSLAQKLGEALENGKMPRINKIVSSVLGTNIRNARQLYAVEWTESAYSRSPRTFLLGNNQVVVDALGDLRRMLRSSKPDQLTGVLYGERLVVERFDYDKCLEWLSGQPYGDGFIKNSGLNPEAFVEAVNQLRAAFGAGLDKNALEVRQKPIDRITEIIGDLKGRIGLDCTDDVMDCILHRFDGIKPGVVADDFDDDGALCKPEITHELRDLGLSEQIRAYIITKLLNEGKLSPIQVVMGLRP